MKKIIFLLLILTQISNTNAQSKIRYYPNNWSLLRMDKDTSSKIPEDLSNDLKRLFKNMYIDFIRENYPKTWDKKYNLKGDYISITSFDQFFKIYTKVTPDSANNIIHHGYQEFFRHPIAKVEKFWLNGKYRENLYLVTKEDGLRFLNGKDTLKFSIGDNYFFKSNKFLIYYDPGDDSTFGQEVPISGYLDKWSTNYSKYSRFLTTIKKDSTYNEFDIKNIILTRGVMFGLKDPNADLKSGERYYNFKGQTKILYELFSTKDTTEFDHNLKYGFYMKSDISKNLVLAIAPKRGNPYTSLELIYYTQCPEKVDKKSLAQGLIKRIYLKTFVNESGTFKQEYNETLVKKDIVYDKFSKIQLLECGPNVIEWELEWFKNYTKKIDKP